MAEKIIKKLDEQLNCGVCLDVYTDPRLLQCFHIFCTECIAKLLVRDHIGRLSLYGCPTCRQVTPVPPNGVTGLQSAFQVGALLEIRDELMKAKDEFPSQETTGEAIEVDQTPSKPNTQLCSEHPGQELKLYCETCNELICYKCGTKGGKHRNHDYDSLDVAFAKYKEEIMPSLAPMENQLETVTTALAELDTRSGEIADQRVTIEASIHDTIRRLHEILDTRKTELIGQLQQLVPPGTTDPSAEDGVTFSVSPDIAEACKNYGTVFSPESPDPSRCHATGEGLEVAMVGEKSTAIMEAISFNGEPCLESIRSLVCVLVSEMTGFIVGGSLERTGPSRYEISYQPTIKGRHQLHVKVDDQHIRGSSFPVVVKLPVEKLGTPILTIHELKEPHGVAFNKKGEVMIIEAEGHCISVFNSSGEKLRSLGIPGSDPGELERPCDIAVDAEGNILVVDIYRLQKFTAEGQFLLSLGSDCLPNDSEEVGHLCVSRGNPDNPKIYMVDRRRCIHILNSDFTISSTFGKYGSGKGEFCHPRDIACDSTGNVYVADCNNHRIQVFTAEGKFLRMFGRHGYGRGELYRPNSIALDSSDRVYVCNRNHRISVFTSGGEFITMFGQDSEEPGEVRYPGELAVDASGVVYVCDAPNNCIHLF